MKEYIILQSLQTIPFGSFKKFNTYEEALNYAKTLTYGVTVYESVARTEIKHEITEIHENNSGTARIKNGLS